MDPFIDAVLLPNEQIGPDQASVILANKEKWNDEEKVRFEGLTEKGFTPPETDPNPLIHDLPKKDEPVAPAPTAPAPATTPAAPATPSVTPTEKGEITTFKTKAELDEYIAKKMQEMGAQGATPAEKKEVKEDIVEFWKYAKNEETGEMYIPRENSPRDWNHAFNYFLQQLVSNPDIFIHKVAPYFREVIRELDNMESARYQEINKEYDGQLGKLFAEGKIPDPKSAEGIQVDKALTNIALQYNLFNKDEPYIAAYELWAKIPVEKGGGYTATPAAPAAPAAPTPQEKKAAQKKIASMATPTPGGGGEDGNAKPRKNYAKVHNTKLDAILARHQT